MVIHEGKGNATQDDVVVLLVLVLNVAATVDSHGGNKVLRCCFSLLTTKFDKLGSNKYT